MLGKGDRLTTPEISALCLSSEQRALSIPSAALALCPSPDLREQLPREQLPHPSSPSGLLEPHPLGWSKRHCWQYESVPGTPASEEIDDRPLSNKLCLCRAALQGGYSKSSKPYFEISVHFPICSLLPPRRERKLILWGHKRRLLGCPGICGWCISSHWSVA